MVRNGNNFNDTITVIPMTGISRSLGYRVPEPLRSRVSVGSLVKVPLLNRSHFAIVEAFGHDSEFPLERLKYIHSVEQPFPVATPESIQLAKWMSVYYSAGIDSVFEVMVPRAIRRGIRPEEKRLIKLSKRLAETELEALKRRAKRQYDLYRFLNEQVLQESFSRTEIQKRLKLSSSVIDSMVEKGILEESKERIHRSAYDDEFSDSEKVQGEGFSLTEEQLQAANYLSESLAKDTFSCCCVHGVTGSGKTEVYLSAMHETLAMGGNVIFLVPEVALTPQTVGRLRARLEANSGAKAVVWHSHLSDGQRFDAWEALAMGKARVVVGARSAIFAPLPNVKLIIVDEEHEPAYKQAESPRYHGRDVAVYRASLSKALCLLGSATPSMETLHNVATKKYDVVRLLNRVDDRKLPILHVVDMKGESYKGKGISVFSRMLVDKLKERFEKGEQSILFMNRRGHDASLNCPDCGFVAMCDHCDISLTHHLSDSVLRCHMCGFEDYVPAKCPKCKSSKIHYKGAGTQKVEAIAKQLLPRANIVRIDADTMQRKHHFRSLLQDFRLGKIDVLVGTQMIAKGLDFPNVTLVGLINADMSLHLPDFRASERTFQLLVQVSGRAGRGDLAGEVVVQTYLPHADPIQFARHQEFDGFAEHELAQRKEFSYPPFRHLIHHLIRSKSREKAEFFAKQWIKIMEKEILVHENIEIRGPAPCPVERVQDYFRYQIWYFVPNVSRLMPRLNQLRRDFKWDKDIIEVLDVDALHLV